ncbi:ABC transporter substrate-binding protein [Phaeovulum vinaykumarii]|uniref:Glycine betaine/proline transport system substrate-binding protein n=1 Tax=Phaeovulum vinaykumarii TaxID=407234 RepID=A0A1N7M1P0_9RHOB|nr:ABC transporter substrate-binding protein [Phaeovulum vinaykumarii]SIS80020.1 glycine betaine/proline transport system substrate-binding protein [Phaeovulum vinaykumarii]SOC09444.1 glycine betaine/proline transport system substrate-binding protein [Phaeovulum vinaykumarii]
MSKQRIASALALMAGLGLSPALAEDACGAISVAEMNWASAGVAAWVDKIILENGYGCDVTLVTGDTMPTFTSMNEKSEPDLAPELWVNAVRTPLDAAVAEGRMVIAAPMLSDGGVEGWWIPKYLADAHPEIKTVQDALEHPELFPAPEDPSRGGVHNCPSGWNCRVSTTNLFRALDAESKGFDLVDTGSAAGLDGSIANAYERKQGWLGYYWAPTAILGKYEMTRLDWGVPNDRAEWDSCTAVPDCPEPKVNAYPVSDVYTVVTREFADKAGVAMDYVQTRQWDNQTVGKVLAWMDENQGTNEDAAYHFLENYKDMWTKWLPEDVAGKVEAAL